MNTLTSVAPVITADRDALRRDFPLKPFAIRHKLAGHPLLMLPRIAQLASELPRDLIEYNSGKVAISQDPDAIPAVDLDPVEVVKSIETAGAWMVLKRVENSPEYRALLEDTLLSVARARGFNSLADAGFEQVEGFLFVSSPNSTTPFHLDSEDNFFVHIHGEKFFTIFDNADRTIVSDDEIERSMTKHRNLKYDESFAPRGQEFHLFAGDGCYVPYQWPHWVRTSGSFSISMAITWKTREVRRLNDLHFFNSMLRGIGLPQQPPGKQPLLDALKLAFYRTVTTAIKPLRASMAMRRVLRRIALGKRANYYLKGTREATRNPGAACSVAPDCAELSSGAHSRDPRFAPSGLHRHASLQRRMRRRQHDGGVHLLEKARTLAEEFLPGRILHGIATRFGARIQAGIGPDVAGFVRLARFGRPEAYDL